MAGDLFGQAALPGNRLTRPLGELLADTAPDWQPMVQAWRASAAGQALVAHVDGRREAGATIYPGEPLRALALTPLAAVKVVILGQDPYHGPGQAEGLSFSVPPGVKPPRSLGNIFVELQRDLGLKPPGHGHLLKWAQRGVLLLNTSLTVEDGQPGSHAKRGWEALTDALILALAQRAAPTVFMLWGGHAQAKAGLIEQAAPGRHLLLQSNHPSPLSARRPPVPFIGCGHFSAAMAAVPGLDWSLD
ncbi:uracil-DNA glycosylase [Ideonella azotifigens]|uniref:Uracil-DNA glycosylase n=2 Tax=Ideonella azotifigens TaxID=513160 RepID=A0ABN1K9V5_9BURK|nr:uracil-DNA glycosylase [Ideonella azotifigens]